MKTIKWLGSKVCNSCGDLCEVFLYDAKTKQGPWAVLCEQCFKWFGFGLGTGLGQKYARQPNGEWHKVEG